MKARIVERLSCPICRCKLHLWPFVDERIAVYRGENPKHCGEELDVKVGVVVCEQCRVWYPIANYVPVMLVFRTPFHASFEAQYRDRLARLDGYGPPDRQPQPGEASVHETFTEEWDQLHQDELSFKYTTDDLKLLNREVWLRWISQAGIKPNALLNIGVGLGRETEALHSLWPDAEMFGVDLNFALLQSAQRLKARAGLHFVIASLFALPFAVSSFELVYSQGVIHHTYSTRDAFKTIAQFVTPGGYLFVWVYGLDDHLVLRGPLGVANRAQWHVETVVRPLVNRAPAPLRDLFFGVLTALVHPLVRSRMIHKRGWKWRNTNHGLRDWLSPRYAHRHSYNELLEWYEELGFRIVELQSPSAYRKLFGKRLWGVGVTGQRSTDLPLNRPGFPGDSVT
jgi:SAM-dependent methyltransferase/uncharacterized protein YbaR (Trm112 family)